MVAEYEVKQGPGVGGSERRIDGGVKRGFAKSRHGKVGQRAATQQSKTTLPRNINTRVRGSVYLTLLLPSVLSEISGGSNPITGRNIMQAAGRPMLAEGGFAYSPEESPE